MFVVQHGASIRYRRSIDAFVPFKVVTQLIYWDERSLYFEQFRLVARWLRARRRALQEHCRRRECRSYAG